MESFEDDVLLPLPEQPSPLVSRPKLKRLKKAAAQLPAAISPSDVLIVPALNPTPPVPAADLPEGQRVPDSQRSADVFPPMVESEGFGEEAGIDDDLDPLFAAPLFSKASDPPDLEWEREDEEEEMMHLDGGGEGENKGKGKMSDGLRKEKSAKKRLSLEDEVIPKPKKRRARKSVGPDGKPKESAREKKRLENERKVHLEQMHAESQRLLRETRDASFKPVPLVQKPISSVLEKIRLRKLEVLKKYNFLYQSDSTVDLDSPKGEIALNSNSPKTRSNTREVESVRMAGVISFSGDDVQIPDAGTSANFPGPCGTAPDTKASDKETEDAFQNLADDTQDDSNEGQLNDRENNLLVDTVDDTLEDIPIPSLSASSSRCDSDDVSSSEEDNDKENIDPCPRKAVDMDLYPKGGPVKAFVDDEAEEEDDSDHDLMRFEENEDDDESEEDEEVNDLIATGFVEAPVDHEKRNQLHQKWLEQQDAAATDNVWQRLKCGKKQREPTLPYEEDDEDFDVDSKDETSYDLHPSSVLQKNSKKAKQMIAQMFNDGNDAYVPSDDEETEQTLIRQRLLKQTEETSFISPLEDDNSREVFGLIKKLNIAPDSKKRGKATTSSFDMLLTGGNSNSSSKSSFLGRTTSNSLPSLHKQGSTTVRTFIFGRDDSNSRNSISTSENVSDMDRTEDLPTKTSSTKFCSSQFKPPVSKTKNDAGSSSGSLFEILRQSSVQFDKRLESKNRSNPHVITGSQAAHQFSAFKLRRFSKVEARI